MLLTYALGRGLEYTDMPVRAIVVREAAGQRLPVFVARGRDREERAVPDAERAESRGDR